MDQIHDIRNDYYVQGQGDGFLFRIACVLNLGIVACTIRNDRGGNNFRCRIGMNMLVVEENVSTKCR